MERDLTEHEVRSETVFRGRLLHVCRDEVRLPNGALAHREYIKHPGAVMIIPMLDKDTVVLERQFRYPARRHFYELPAGKKEIGEDPLVTAQRELQEETGYRAKRWRKLASTYPCVGYADEVIDFFLAEELEYVGASLDDGEFLEVVPVSIAEGLRWIAQGKICDIKTIAGLLWAEKIWRGEPLE
jgi:ADP-ribose pyrophosphatase